MALSEFDLQERAMPAIAFLFAGMPLLHINVPYASPFSVTRCE